MSFENFRILNEGAVEIKRKMASARMQISLRFYNTFRLGHKIFRRTSVISRVEHIHLKLFADRHKPKFIDT